MTEFTKKTPAQIAADLMTLVMADDVRGARELLKSHGQIAREVVNSTHDGRTMMREARGIPMQSLLMRYEGRPSTERAVPGVPDMSEALYYDTHQMAIATNCY